MLTIDQAKRIFQRADSIYHSPKKKANGQLVVLGCDVSTYTPAPYQRCRLQRP